MNDGSGGRGSGGQGSGGRGGLVRRCWQRAGVLAIVAGLAMLAAGCGSGPSRSLGSYSACMRQHGVTGALADRPQPPSSFLHSSLSTPGRGATVHQGQQIPARVSAALQACLPLAPPPGQGSAPG
jgi:hypothetical protein